MSQNQHVSTTFTFQGMRKFVCDRLTEAAQEILGAFEKRAQEYESELSRQRRLLERVYSEDNNPHTGPSIKEEQREICIADIHRESPSSNPNDVHNADRPETERTSHLETHNPRRSQKTNKHERCSHGYRLPKSHVPRQNRPKEENGPLVVIEIEDDSPASSDVEVIQYVDETSRNANTNRNTTSERSKKYQSKSGEKNLPQPHSPELDDNNNNEFETTADNTENETTSESLDASKSVYDGEKITSPYDVKQSEELLCEGSTGDATDEKGKSYDEKSGKELQMYGIESNTDNDHEGRLRLSPEQARVSKDVTDATSSTTGRQNDTASNTSKERSKEISTVDQSLGWKGPKQPEPQPSQKNPFECNQCGKVSTNFKSYKSHVKWHTSERKFGCETCGTMFREKGNLKKHLTTHAAEKPFKCPECGRGFNRRFNMVLHGRRHTGERPYPCGSCDKTFTTQVNRRKHQRTHTGEKPYACEHCGREFRDSSTLRTHQRVHTGERPYTCSRCEKKFATATTLKRHGRVHSGERPYECSVCLKSFVTSSELKVHGRTHTGERPYKCERCEQEFSWRANYSRHLKAHTRSAESLAERR